MLARVFGAIETLYYLSVAIGALLIPPLVSAFGPRWTLVITGLFLPVVALAPGRACSGSTAPRSPPRAPSRSCASCRSSRRFRRSRSSGSRFSLTS